MAKSKSAPKNSETTKPSSKGATLDIIFSGPLLFVPAVERGNVASVEVFAPQNGHPIGAVFLPGIRFSDAELNDPLAERWPTPESFSLLDSHSYSIELEQSGKSKPFPVASISVNNHKVKAGRRLSHDWDISVGVTGRISSWTSHREVAITAGMLGGSDVPTVATVTNTQKLTYEGVKAAYFHGISKPQQQYLKANIAKGGTLIVIGEIPYQASLLHERQAVDAMARLAGLNLHLLSAEPVTSAIRITGHKFPCSFSSMIVP
jgi:hypothetical protein